MKQRAATKQKRCNNTKQKLQAGKRPEQKKTKIHTKGVIGTNMSKRRQRIQENKTKRTVPTPSRSLSLRGFSVSTRKCGSPIEMDGTNPPTGHNIQIPAVCSLYCKRKQNNPH
jgi:hypothetical protein